MAHLLMEILNSNLLKDLRALSLPCMQVTILFTDCIDFTAMANQVEPVQVMSFLHKLYSKYAHV